MKTLFVAAGLMIKDGKVLVAQRKENAHQGLLWEFPGGKVKEGEEPREALRRELKEELDIEAKVGAFFEAVFYPYPQYSILLLAYRCEIDRGIPQPLCCRALQWANMEALKRLPMPPADEPIRKRLCSPEEEVLFI